MLFLFQETERFHIPFPLVGSSGLEPPTSRLSGVRSNHLSYEPILGYHRLSVISLSSRGGDEEDRTPDPLRARQVLSQLSYTPIFSGFQGLCRSYLYSLFEFPISWTLKIKQCFRFSVLLRNKSPFPSFSECLTRV